MRRFWRLLTRGCWSCQWEVIDKCPLVVHRDYGDDRGHRLILRCTKCGWVIMRDLA